MPKIVKKPLKYHQKTPYWREATKGDTTPEERRKLEVQERQIPPEFWENIPPRFIPFLIEEGGLIKQAWYVTIHMENDPYALGMSGPNAPIHHLPAVVVPHPTGSTIPGYT